MLNPIKQARILAEISQADLARMVGVTSGAVSQWEKGATRPSAKRLKKLADALNTTIDSILKEEDDGEAAKCG